MRISGRTTSHGQLGAITPDQHHAILHAPESHSDTGITGAELEILSSSGDADALHTHALLALESALHAAAHTAASHSDQGATGAELETLTDTSDADALHGHTLKANVSALHNQSHPNTDHAGEIRIIKAGDETVTSSTTLQDDDDLLFAVGVNEIWRWRLSIRLRAQTVTPDLKWRFAIPTGGVGGFWYIDALPGSGDLGAPIIDITNTNIAQINSVEAMLVVEGFYIGGANAGNVQLEWAQQVSDANGSSIHRESFLTATRVA